MSETEEATSREELNNQLVVPAYRQFCAHFGLAFHFWDQLPQNEFDTVIADGELLLHKEAMDLFNRAKPELVLFGDQVVRYQFTSWAGDWTGSAVPVADFLDAAADNAFYLEKLEARFKNLVSYLSVLVAFLAGLLLFLLSSRFFSERFGDIQVVLGIAVGAGVYKAIDTRLRRLPRRILDDGRLAGFEDRLVALRTQLAELRGARPNPLELQNSVRLGGLILEELSERMNPSEIQRLVRRLQSKLVAVPRQEGPE